MRKPGGGCICNPSVEMVREVAVMEAVDPQSTLAVQNNQLASSGLGKKLVKTKQNKIRKIKQIFFLAESTESS